MMPPSGGISPRGESCILLPIPDRFSIPPFQLGKRHELSIFNIKIGRATSWMGGCIGNLPLEGSDLCGGAISGLPT